LAGALLLACKFLLAGKVGLQLLLVVHLHFVFLLLRVDFFAVVHIDRQVVVLIVHSGALNLGVRLCGLAGDGLLGGLLGRLFLFIKVVFRVKLVVTNIKGFAGLALSRKTII
jgi:hypothetical protein